MNELKAIIQKIVPDGKHGSPFAVATSEELLGSITFSLDPDVWKEKTIPQNGTFVCLSDIQLKRAGWRALNARFWRPSDEQAKKN